MPNFAALPLQSLGLLVALVFLASLIGHSLSGSSKFLGAIFTVIIFAAAYVFWNYYDHGLVTAIRFRVTSRGAAGGDISLATTWLAAHEVGLRVGGAWHCARSPTATAAIPI